MYNANRPQLAELPSPARLLRSTILAAASAVAILVCVVLPSEYGIDPTGAGRMLGLKDMGETKMQLAAEAAADRAATESNGVAGTPAASPAPDLTGLYNRMDRLEVAVRELSQVVQSARVVNEAAASGVVPDASAAVPLAEAAQPVPEPVKAHPAEPVQRQATAPETVASPSSDGPASEPPGGQIQKHQSSFVLNPGQGIEIKLVMKKGAKANYAWSTEGGPVNFDTHGDGSGNLKISYEKGRGVQSDEGTLTAEFDGNHGWFWRNRNQEPVTLTLSTEGNYSEIKGLPN